jgi:hypothetical protein
MSGCVTLICPEAKYLEKSSKGNEIMPENDDRPDKMLRSLIVADGRRQLHPDHAKWLRRAKGDPKIYQDLVREFSV